MYNLRLPLSHFNVGLLIVRLCFMNDILLFIDLFSCIAGSLFNKLTYLLYLHYCAMAGFPNVTFAFQSPKQKERVDLEADRGIEKYKGKKGKSKKK